MNRFSSFFNPVASALQTFLLLPSISFLQSKWIRKNGELKFVLLASLLIILGLCTRYGWFGYCVVFSVCLSTGFLHHKIYQEQRAIIEGTLLEEEARWLEHAPLLRARFLFCIYPFLLFSLILLLRQAAFFWGSRMFHPPVQDIGAWGMYMLDLVLKAVLFDIPEIYRIELVQIEHVGFWGSTLVFFSRMVVLALFVGALLRWKEIRDLVRDTVGGIDKYKEMGEMRLLLLLRMFPGQIPRIFIWATGKHLSIGTRCSILETLGKTKDSKVLPGLEKVFSKTPSEDLKHSALKGMEHLGHGNVGVVASLFEISSQASDKLKEQACKTLMEWRTPESIVLLARVAREDKSISVRHSAIDALGNAKSPDAIPGLLEIMENGDSSKEERFGAKDALIAGGIFSPSLQKNVQETLFSSPHPDNRRFAAMIAGGLGDQTMLPLLFSCLQTEKDSDTQFYLVESTRRIVQRCGIVPVDSPSFDWGKLVSTLFARASEGEVVFIQVVALQTLCDLALQGLITEQIIAFFKDRVQSPNAQIADTAQEGLSRLARHMQDIQIERRRDCITAVMMQDMAWREEKEEGK